MKVAMFVMWDMSKTAEVAKAADSVANTAREKATGQLYVSREAI